MKVLVVNKYWHMVGGVERHVAEVCAWLAGRGDEVIPFSMDHPDNDTSDYSSYFPSYVDMHASHKRDVIRGIRRAVISSDSRRSLRRLLDDHPVDAAYVVHTYHQLGTAVLNELADRNIPTILSLHDYKVACGNYRLFSERTGAVCTKCLDSPVRSLWAPVTERCWSGSAAAGAALVAEGLATRLRGSYRQPGVVTTLNSLQERAVGAAGVAPERIRRLPHPVTLGPDRDVSGEGVLCVGRLVPEKGVDVLIRACASARLPLTVAGDGRDRPALESLARSLEANVRFLGELSSAETAAVMRGAYILAVPSVWHEVSPLVVYEAMALDVPVIGSAMGGLVDQLGDDRGYLVPAGDVAAWSETLISAVTDPTEARRRSARARDYARTNLTRERWEAGLAESFRLASERSGGA